MKPSFLLLAFLAFFTSAPAQQPSAVFHPPAGPHRPANVPADYVITPFGYFHPSCVLVLKAGEHVTEDGLFHHQDGTSEQVGQCRQIAHFFPDGSPASGTLATSDAAHTATNNGALGQGLQPTNDPAISHSWIEYSGVTTNSAYGKEVSTFTVPPLPITKDGQTIYFFPGFEDYSDVVSILQPVIGSYNGGQWTMASWNCCLAGTADESTPINISPGDTILGTTQMTCSAGTTNCATWNVITQDQTSNLTTQLTSTPNGGQVFNWAFGAVLEVYGVDQCLDYPPNASLTMTSLLYDSNFNQIAAPSWRNTQVLSSSTQPQCSYGVTSTSTQSTLTYGTTGAGFGLGISPAAGIAVNQGSSASGTITITDANGFTGAVSVSLSTPPTGITAQLTPGTAANTYTLTLTASSSAVITAASTPATLTLTASGSGVTTQTFPLNVIVNPPLTGGAGTAVSLTGSYNAYAFFNDSVHYPSINATNSLDGGGTAYSANELSSPGVSPMGLDLGGLQYSFGPPNQANAIYGTGSNPITLPSVQSSQLQILATGFNGAQKSQTLTVTYTDNSTQTYTQTFDDWSTGPVCNAGVCTAGESVAVTMPYTDTEYAYPRNDSIYYLYEYTLALNSAKTLKSLTLPSNRNVALLAATLSVTQQTAAFGTMSFSPSSTFTYSTSQAVTITNTLTYSGTTKPTGAVTFSLNAVAYSATCTGSASPLTCTAVVPAAAIAALPPAAYTVTASLAADSNYTAVTGTGTLTINKATPAISLTASASAVFLQNPVTFTATVSSTLGTPTGSVVFSSGSTTIGTSTLSGGIATLTISTLVAGSQTITAAYGGDTNFSAVTSSGLTELVQDFISTVGSSGTTQTVQPGATATFTFSVSPTVGTTFPSAITLAATGLPSGFIATLTPTSIASGAGATAVTMTIAVPQNALLEQGPQPGGRFPLFALAALLLPLLTRSRRVNKHLHRISLRAFFAAAVLFTTSLTGCSSKSGSTSGNSTQTFTANVTATAGALSHSTTFTLTVP